MPTEGSSEKLNKIKITKKILIERHFLNFFIIKFKRHLVTVKITNPGAYITKLIAAVIYSFRNKVECLSLASLSNLV